MSKSWSVKMLSIILAMVYVVSFWPHQASALLGSQFQAGRIIDDGVFYNSSTLGAPEIQRFLESKVPSCDTGGTGDRSYYYNSSTQEVKSALSAGDTGFSWVTTKRYIYGQRYQIWKNIEPGSKGIDYGSSAPYICLKSYIQTTTLATPNENGLCSSIAPATRSAATTIYVVSQACGINPQVLIVLLEKEQSLVTDTWPWGNQYTKATGYFCTDSAPCDPTYAGFFNQVYYAARQFKLYAKNPSNYNFRSGRLNFIKWNVPDSCGGSNVFIQNQATASLYNYTPYQPNAPALANLYGSSDDLICSSYGNRNFWRLFNDWFGSTYANCVYPESVTNGIYRLYNKGTGNNLLTTDPYEVCVATGIGWMYDGLMFNESSSGGQPVYRLEKSGRYLYTTSSSEKDAATNNYGFRYEGVAFNAVDPTADPTNARAVHRLVSPGGTYLYTISDYERDAFVSYGYRYEGVGFYLKENPGAVVTSVNRLVSPKGIYLFTISDSEKTNAESYGYRYEGIGFSAITQLNKITVPVYRLAGPNGYVLTTNLIERIVATNIGYRNEGVGMYTYGTPDSTGLNSVYRLSSSAGAYLYTTSIDERNSAVSNYGYRLEGVGFFVP